MQISLPSILQERTNPLQKQWQQYLQDSNLNKLLLSCYRETINNLGKFNVARSEILDINYQKVIKYKHADNVGQYSWFMEIEQAIMDDRFMVSEKESDEFVRKLSTYKREIDRIASWLETVKKTK